MKRYNPKTLRREVVGGNPTSVAYMEESPAGRFVAIEDVEELQALEGQVDTLLNTTEKLLAACEALKSRLAQVTQERDQYKSACALADALRNRERGYENLQR